MRAHIKSESRAQAAMAAAASMHAQVTISIRLFVYRLLTLSPVGRHRGYDEVAASTMKKVRCVLAQVKGGASCELRKRFESLADVLISSFVGEFIGPAERFVEAMR